MREALEGEASGCANNDEAVQRALEAAGVEFTNGGQPGVRLRAETKAEFVENAEVLILFRDKQ